MVWSLQKTHQWHIQKVIKAKTIRSRQSYNVSNKNEEKVRKLQHLIYVTCITIWTAHGLHLPPTNIYKKTDQNMTLSV